MFDKDVSKDLSLGTELLPIPQGLVGVTFDDALIGEHCAGVDVDADETSIARGAKSEGSASIVAQYVETDR